MDVRLKFSSHHHDVLLRLHSCGPWSMDRLRFLNHLDLSWWSRLDELDWIKIPREIDPVLARWGLVDPNSKRTSRLHSRAIWSTTARRTAAHQLDLCTSKIRLAIKHIKQALKQEDFFLDHLLYTVFLPSIVLNIGLIGWWWFVHWNFETVDSIVRLICSKGKHWLNFI